MSSVSSCTARTRDGIVSGSTGSGNTHQVHTCTVGRTRLIFLEGPRDQRPTRNRDLNRDPSTPDFTYPDITTVHLGPFLRSVFRSSPDQDYRSNLGT